MSGSGMNNGMSGGGMNNGMSGGMNNGMSGGGMGFIFAPHRRAEAQARLLEIMLATKRELQASLPFAMDPVVYDFAINEHGSVAALLTGADALLPVEFYQLTVPACLRRGTSNRHGRSSGNSEPMYGK